jgi:hypothetical protein
MCAEVGPDDHHTGEAAFLDYFAAVGRRRLPRRSQSWMRDGALVETATPGVEG